MSTGDAEAIVRAPLDGSSADATRIMGLVQELGTELEACFHAVFALVPP